MIGQLTPLILVPRFSSYMGAADFVSAPVDVTAYSDAYVTVWRGLLVGSSPAFQFYVQTSTDAITWTDFDLRPGIAPWVDPGFDTALAISFPCMYRWIRAKVRLEGTSPAVTCWASGFVQNRVEE